MVTKVLFFLPAYISGRLKIISILTSKFIKKGNKIYRLFVKVLKGMEVTKNKI
jgi:hypothetical protein